MTVLRLETDVAELTLSTQGAAVLGWNLRTDTGLLPPTLLAAPRMRPTAPPHPFWLENTDHLPTKEALLPADRVFRNPTSLPNRWISNGFEG